MPCTSLLRFGVMLDEQARHILGWTADHSTPVSHDDRSLQEYRMRS
jgi:hypothetical protein